MTAWRVTSLSVSPTPYQMAAADRQAFRFNAEEPITGAVAMLTNLRTGAVVALPAGSVTTEAEAAIVTISGLTAGVSYQLAVTFTRSDTIAWTRTLILECVL
jgi:hypothetical protein